MNPFRELFSILFTAAVTAADCGPECHINKNPVDIISCDFPDLLFVKFYRFRLIRTGEVIPPVSAVSPHIDDPCSGKFPGAVIVISNGSISNRDDSVLFQKRNCLSEDISAIQIAVNVSDF